LFADLPVFMKTAHGAGLMDGGTKFVFPAAGFQHTQLKKAFTPEGMIFGHNTLYFALSNAPALQREFVADYYNKYKDYPHWEADRAYFAMEVYKAGVEAAYKAKNAWPSNEDVINAMEGIKVQSLGGPGHMRKDHIAEQTFYQGLTTHANNYDFPTLGRVDVMYSDQLQKPAGEDFWHWIETAQIKL
ncbi:MAG TPA: ABC transporter substrate-binding protein, partial [Usitatibacter sp.]|nr:ABC transporter substrate-binding protein [Usitatibacter sp.]